MPLQRRLPKFGFNNIFRRELAEVKVGDLEGLSRRRRPGRAEGAGLVRGNRDGVVVLGERRAQGRLTVKVHRVDGRRARRDREGGRQGGDHPRARHDVPEGEGREARGRGEVGRRRRDRRGAARRAAVERTAKGDRWQRAGLSTSSRSRSSGSGSSSRSGCWPSTGSASSSRRPGVDRNAMQTRRRSSGQPARPLQHVLRRRVRAALDLRARHHAVRLGVASSCSSSPWSCSRSRSSEGGRAGRRKINQYTRYGTIVLSRAPGLRHRHVPRGAARPAAGTRRRRRRPGLGLPPHDDDLAHRRHRLHHVDGRADHRARHRQRHLAHHLRRHRRARPAARSDHVPGVSTRARRSSQLGARRRSSRIMVGGDRARSCSSSAGSGGSRSSTRSAWSAGSCTAARRRTCRSR